MSQERAKWHPIKWNKLPKPALSHVHELWRRGNLRFLLHPRQKYLYDEYHNKKDQQIVINCTRQFGKSFLMFVLALEHCIRYPNSTVWYMFPYKAWGRRVYGEQYRQVTASAPKNLRRSLNKNSGVLRFENGSQLNMVGTERGGIEMARGSAANLVILDECGRMDNLIYCVDGVIYPMFTTTSGRLLMISTPSPTVGHAFNQRFIKDAKERKNYYQFTIYDNPFLTDDEIEEAKSRLPGGDRNPEWLRERMADPNVSDANRLVAFTYRGEDVQRRFFKDYKKPALYQPYIGIDFGQTADTAILFAIFDPAEAALVVLDEVAYPHMLGRVMYDEIERGMATHFTPLPGMPPLPSPILIADHADPGRINDIIDAVHGLDRLSLGAKNLDQFINNLNIRLDANQIYLDIDKCPKLHDQLTSTIWNEAKKGFAKMGTAAHSDSLMALVYTAMRVNYQQVISHQPTHSKDHWMIPEIVRSQSIVKTFQSPTLKRGLY